MSTPIEPKRLKAEQLPELRKVLPLLDHIRATKELAIESFLFDVAALLRMAEVRFYEEFGIEK